MSSPARAASTSSWIQSASVASSTRGTAATLAPGPAALHWREPAPTVPRNGIAGLGRSEGVGTIAPHPISRRSTCVLEIEVDHTDSYTLCRPVGELDAYTVDQLP